jgi:competence protein ComGC
MKKSFTLVEILVLLAIAGVLMGLLIPAISKLNNLSEKNSNYTEKRLELIDEPLKIDGNRIYLIRDKKTNLEFIYTNSGSIVHVPLQ